MERVAAIPGAVEEPESEFTARSIGVLVAAIVALTFSAGVLSTAVSLFFLPITQAFGWSQTAYTSLALVSTYASAITGFFLGRATDRWGARKVILPLAFYTAFPIMGLSLLDGSILQGTLLFMMLGIGFATSVCYVKLFASYFRRRFGMALAIYGMAVGLLMGPVLPPLMQALYVAVGWRQSFLISGIAYLLIASSVQFVFARDPEAPTTQPLAPDESAHVAAEPGVSLARALRSRAIWIIFATDLIAMMIYNATRVHIVPLFVERGLSTNIAIGVLASVGLGALLIRPVTGWCLDRFDTPRVILPFLIATALAVATLAFGGAALSGLFLGMLFVNLGGGMELSGSGNYLLARYYGRRHYGQLVAITYIATPVGLGLGPLVVGYLHDRTGTYGSGLAVLLGLSLLAVILATLLKSYRFDARGADGT